MHERESRLEHNRLPTHSPQNQSLPTDSDSLPALLESAMARQRGGDLAGAARLYLQILQREPRHFEALHRLGVARAQAGDPAAAERHLVDAVEVAPGSAEARLHLAHVLMALGQAQNALSAYEQALTLKSEYPEALYGHGNA